MKSREAYKGVVQKQRLMFDSLVFSTEFLHPGIRKSGCFFDKREAG